MLNAKDAELRFSEFQSAMFQWDVRFHPLMKENTPKYIAESMTLLKLIFDEYLHNYRIDYGRMTGPSTSSPPDYDPETDIIYKIEAGRTKVKIYVQKTTQFKEAFRYTLAEHDGKWMIEKKEIYWIFKKRWGKFEL